MESIVAAAADERVDYNDVEEYWIGAPLVLTHDIDNRRARPVRMLSVPLLDTIHTLAWAQAQC